MRSREGGCFGCCSGCVGEVLHHAASSNTRSLARLPQLQPTLCQTFSTKIRVFASPRLSNRWCWRMATAATKSQGVWQGKVSSHENRAVWQAHTEHRHWSPYHYFSLDQKHFGSKSAHSISPCCNSHHGTSTWIQFLPDAGRHKTCSHYSSRHLVCMKENWSPAPAMPWSMDWLPLSPISESPGCDLTGQLTSGLSRLQFQPLRLMRWNSPHAVDHKTWNFQVLLHFL